MALFVHDGRDQARDLALDAVDWLLDRGHEVRIPHPDAVAVGRPELGMSEAEIATGLDVALSLGGDGTMLRTVETVASEVPVIGVNLGQLGYLTEVEPGGVRVALKRFLAGSHEIEDRMLLSVVVDRGGEVEEHHALNEAVLEKTPLGHTVRLAVSIEGEYFTTYAADGLIVATPTGSTAYAFSARGPIVSPTHRAILLTPVSPHMLFDRTLVLDDTQRVRVEVEGPRPATVSVDGRNLGDLAPGDAVVCTAARRSARLVTYGPRDFLRILSAKFGLHHR